MWDACPYNADQAILSVRCAESGERFRVRVPKGHAWSPLGWSGRARVRFGTPARIGLEVDRGDSGVVVRTGDGSLHILPHGAYEALPADPSELQSPLVKADQGGERWITVHPSGNKADKGVPVRIKPAGDGTYRVIGGAGGKLQHLRLRGVKSEAEYKQEAKERRKEKQSKNKERKAAQTPKEAEREKVTKDDAKAAKLQAERNFVNAVRDKLGGIDEDLDEGKLKGLSSGAKNLILSRHHKKQLRQAQKRKLAVARQLQERELQEVEARTRLERAVHEDPVLGAEVEEMAQAELELSEVEREEARAERAQRRTRHAAAGAGKLAAEQVRSILESHDKDPRAELARLESLKDIDGELQPSVEKERRAYAALAEADRLVAEADANPENREKLLRQASKKVRRFEIERMHAEKYAGWEASGEENKAKAALAYADVMGGIQRAAGEAKRLGLLETEQTPMQEWELHAAMDVLRDAERLRDAQREYRQVVKDAESGNYDRSRRAFTLRTSDELTQAVTDRIEDQVRQDLARRLLGVASSGRSALQMAVADGHHAAIADVALAVAGSNVVDRTALDAVGMKNAAALTRWALERDGKDAKEVLGALESYHVGTQNDITRRALAQAEAYAPGIEQAVGGVDDIEHALRTMEVQESSLNEAQRAVGSALGRLEAVATLAQAHREPVPSELTIDAPDGVQSALGYLHAAGLTPEDYSLIPASGDDPAAIRIPESSYAKLTRMDDKSVVEQRQRANDIKAGQLDEEGWLPAGITTRPAESWDRPVPAPDLYSEPIDLTGFGAEPEPAGLFGGPPSAPGPSRDEVSAMLKDHVGARLANGEPAWEIDRDLRSPFYVGQVGEAGRDDYQAILGELFPRRDAEGDLQKAEFFDAHYQGLAEAYAKKAGVEAFHGQGLEHGPKTSEAVFRALAEHPAAKHAFTPSGELDHKGRAAVREAFYRKMGIADTRSYQKVFDESLAELGDEPAKESKQVGFFGGGGVSEDWKKWKEDALELVRAYPKEGKDLGIRLLGDRPESKRHPALTDEVISAMADVHKEAPWLNAEGLAKWTRHRLGHAAAKAKGLDPEAIDTLGRTNAELNGPRIMPAHVADYRAPELHDNAVRRLQKRASYTTPWQQYAEMHGGTDNAVRAMQDELRGQFTEAFSKHYGQQHGKALKTGVVDIHNGERHVMATGTPEVQKAYRKARATRMDGLRDRNQVGRYADMGGGGALLEREQKDLEQATIAKQGQGIMFGGGQAQEPATPEISPGSRLGLGSRVEAQLRGYMRSVGHGFDPNQPMSLYSDVDMHKGKRVHQQRVIKMLTTNGGRLGGWLGTGSGKTPTSIGAFTELATKNPKLRGLFAVPVAVQSQFGSEMLQFTDPGAFRWKTSDGMSHQQRVELLRSPDTHMRVMTHQSLVRTAVQVMADHHGMDRDAWVEKFGAMSQGEQAAAWKAAREAADIPQQYVYVDEAHMLTQRAGQDPSLTALVMDAISHPDNASHLLLGTATPHKNDTSEMWSMAKTLDPKRYGDRDAFMRNYGSGTAEHAPDALRRELGHMTYSQKIPPKGVERIDTDNPVIADGQKQAGGPIQLDPAHAARVKAVNDAFESVRKANKTGGVDVDAVKVLSPKRFEGVPESQHREVAAKLQRSAGILRESALRREINGNPEHNQKLQRMADAIEHDLNHGTWNHRKTGETHRGKPSVVFTSRTTEARMIHAALEKRGIRVGLYHGGLGSSEREKVRNGFQPKGDNEPAYDVVIATNAAEAGVNWQRAKVIHHYDTPDTWKTHAQRSGRAYRQGQNGDVDVHNWRFDHAYEATAARRLTRKQGLANAFETPLGNLDEHGFASHWAKTQAVQHQDRELAGYDALPLAAK